MLTATALTIESEVPSPEKKHRGRPAKALAVATPAPVPAPIILGDGPNAFLQAIVTMASNPQIDADKLERLLAMQEHLEAKEAERLFNEELRAVQQAVPHVQKNGTVKLGTGKGYKFATWEDMDTVLRPILVEHGFSLSFTSEPRDSGGILVTGTLTHTGGHSKSASMLLPIDTGAGRNAVQATGSSLSYGKRYVTEMLVNLIRAGEDNDASTADPIAAEQAEELLKLMEETGTHLGRFLSTMVSNTKSVEMVQKADFVRLRNALLAKKAKLAREHANEEAPVG